MAGNAALGFGALVAGAIIIDYGVKNARGAINSNNSSSRTAPASGTVATVGGFPPSVDPLPDSVGSRLDQGIDGTGKTFLSPWSGHVVVSNAHDSGWKGGGYVAVQSDHDPNMVYYLAEGITPIVKLGQTVKAGDRIAYPVSNPYNGIVGNFEAGRADPGSPGRPLAQATANATGEVLAFYDWLRKLGGPKATSTGSAGHG